MPKKHRSLQFSKPASPIHPSLSPTSSSSSSRAVAKQAPQSVNELLVHLRRNQGSFSEDKARELAAVATSRTVHPSLKEILDVVDTPPPRPRPGLRATGAPGRAMRRPPGPPPPRSWLTSMHAPRELREEERERQMRLQTAMPHSLGRLPDARVPAKRSLLHQAMKALARDWEWHMHYDQHYLATLPVDLKATLLSYITVFGPDIGVGIEGLRTLFLTQDELPGATGSEELTHLDLSVAIGRSITFKQLDAYLSLSPSLATSTATLTLDSATSWETEADLFSTKTALPASLPTPRFPSLTHLSLSHPPPTISWPRLLAFMPHLATLTHLSLAHWPAPSLTPNARTTTVSSKYSPSSLSYSGTGFYAALDGDWREAAGILRRLSRATYCLRWLDLDGCQAWWGALGFGLEDDEGPEWNGGWRRVEFVGLSQGWVPAGVREGVEDLRRGRGRPSPPGVPQHDPLRSQAHAQPQPEAQGPYTPPPSRHQNYNQSNTRTFLSLSSPSPASSASSAHPPPSPSSQQQPTKTQLTTFLTHERTAAAIETAIRTARARAKPRGLLVRCGRTWDDDDTGVAGGDADRGNFGNIGGGYSFGSGCSGGKGKAGSQSQSQSRWEKGKGKGQEKGWGWGGGCDMQALETVVKGMLEGVL
ncbi:MAG: hypothetical protein M1819_006711 [Sarea resinae]|nr:MAG: hypothetical protein M1819_006711 [Sarea resinae]